MAKAQFLNFYNYLAKVLLLSVVLGVFLFYFVFSEKAAGLPTSKNYNPDQIISLWFNQSSLIKNQRILLAQNSLTEAFDPFIDYGEFQDDVVEEESILFFQHGRSLILSLIGGYEAVSFNMRQIYGDAPFIFGLSLQFFIDLRMAMQAVLLFPYTHYNSLFSNNFKFYRYGLNIKYYLNQQYLKHKGISTYFVIGPFLFKIKPNLSGQAGTKDPIPIVDAPVTTPLVNGEDPDNVNDPTTGGNSTTGFPEIPGSESSYNRLDLQAVRDHLGFGLKLGLGIEIPFIKQSFIGLEIAYLYYPNLLFENTDLTILSENFPPANNNPNQTLFEEWLHPNRPNLDGYLFFGDMAILSFIIGLDF